MNRDCQKKIQKKVPKKSHPFQLSQRIPEIHPIQSWPGEGSPAGDGWRSQGGGPCCADARLHLRSTWMGGEGLKLGETGRGQIYPAGYGDDNGE